MVNYQNLEEQARTISSNDHITIFEELKRCYKTSKTNKLQCKCLVPTIESVTHWGESFESCDYPNSLGICNKRTYNGKKICSHLFGLLPKETRDRYFKSIKYSGYEDNNGMVAIVREQVRRELVKVSIEYKNNIYRHIVDTCHESSHIRNQNVEAPNFRILNNISQTSNYTDSKSGYVYLIEFHSEDYVKIGMTTRSLEIRMKEYTDFKNILGHHQCDDCLSGEKTLKDAFRKEFSLPVKGNEFFKADKVKAIEIFKHCFAIN